VPGSQPQFDNCGNREVSSKRGRKILHQGETARGTACLEDNRMERMSIARWAGSTGANRNCRSPPYDRSDYSILVKVARPARAKLLLSPRFCRGIFTPAESRRQQATWRYSGIAHGLRRSVLPRILQRPYGTSRAASPEHTAPVGSQTPLHGKARQS